MNHNYLFVSGRSIEITVGKKRGRLNVFKTLKKYIYFCVFIYAFTLKFQGEILYVRLYLNDSKRFLPKGRMSPLPLAQQPPACPLWGLCNFGRLPSTFL